jgi:hypothetical protein
VISCHVCVNNPHICWGCVNVLRCEMFQPHGTLWISYRGIIFKADCNEKVSIQSKSKPHTMWTFREVFININGCILDHSSLQLTCTAAQVQGDSREKVNSLWGDNIGHCEKESSYEHVPNCYWLLRQWCLHLQIKINVSGIKEREITYCYFHFNFNLMFTWQICCREQFISDS